MGTNPHRARTGRAYSEDEGAVHQVGVEVREFTGPPAAPLETAPEDSGFADFAAAGTEVSGDFRCPDCGYGAVVHRALPPCPMCGGTVWESLGLLARHPAD